MLHLSTLYGARRPCASTPYMHASTPPSPAPRPEIDVWFQTAGRGTALPLHVLKIIYLPRDPRGRAPIASEPARASRNPPAQQKKGPHTLGEGVLDVRRVPTPIHRREVEEVVGPVPFIIE